MASHVARVNRLISVRAGVSAGQSELRRKPPEAAVGSSIPLLFGVAAAKELKE
jgi:hypothetical protein